MKRVVLLLWFSRFDLSNALAFSSSERKGDISLLSVEKSLQERGFPYVVGTDEVGRGAIAGPVVAVSCCIFSETFTHSNQGNFSPISGVGDSKKLTEQDRNHVFEQISQETDSYKWAIAQRSQMDIDNTNILKATMETFRESI